MEEKAAERVDPRISEWAEDPLHNDPFVMAHPEWIAAIKQLLQMGVRAEQQALAKWGLNSLAWCGTPA